VVLEIVSPAEAHASPARVPGSLRVWRPDYQQPLTATQRLDGLLPHAADFQELMRRLGVDDGTEVVVLSRKYDETRLWWLLTVYGKRHVYVLDGGYDAYVGAGLPMAMAEPPPCARGTWTAAPLEASMVATRAQTLAARKVASAASAASSAASAGRGTSTSGGGVRLWDVRSVGEYAGTLTLPGAARPGRIAWATARVDWDLFRRDDGRWRDPLEIRILAAETLGGATPDDAGPAHIFYCQSAVRTTQLIFGLARAGWPLERLKNYDGSWVEWSHLAPADEIATG
jgi:thiosulfate/3-mercaptopyruvate sulfurtransferase